MIQPKEGSKGARGGGSSISKRLIEERKDRERGLNTSSAAKTSIVL